MNKWNSIVIPLLLAACTAPPKPEPPPRVITVDVPTVVQRGCPDRRPAADEYPDTDDKLAAIPRGDIEQLGRVYRAGRDLRDKRLALDDVQIRGCE